MNFVPPEAIGWAAFAITVVYAAVMYGVGRFRDTPFWKTRLISGPVELLGYFVFGWAIRRHLAAGPHRVDHLHRAA